jgi:hypothetical protein
MKRTLAIVLLALAVFLPACNTDSVRNFPGQVVKRFRPKATATQSVAASLPTSASGTAAAVKPTTAASTPTQVAASANTPVAPTASAASKASATPAAASKVMIFFVALGDNGGSGQKIGCGDSLIPVQRDAPATQDVLRAALEQLLSQHDRFYGESGLYNALYQSDLKIESFSVTNGTATVHLTGTLKSGGVCDGPRIQEQLTQTAIQPHLSIARDAKIFVNGTPLADLLSGK